MCRTYYAPGSPFVMDEYVYMETVLVWLQKDQQLFLFSRWKKLVKSQVTIVASMHSASALWLTKHSGVMRHNIGHNTRGSNKNKTSSWW